MPSHTCISGRTAFFTIKIFYDVDHFLKSFIGFVAILLFFSVLFFFGHEACGILVPQPGIKPAPLAVKGEVLTTGPPGKSLSF